MPKPSLINLSPFCHREPFLLPKGEYWGVSCTSFVSVFCTFKCIFLCCQQNNKAGFWLPLLFLLIQGFTFPSFLPQPVINGYRNKSTFSVNQGPDGNPKTVGLYVGTGKGQCRIRSWVESCWHGLSWGEALLCQSPPELEG